jgi:hypothetical protein
MPRTILAICVAATILGGCAHADDETATAGSSTTAAVSDRVDGTAELEPLAGLGPPGTATIEAVGAATRVIVTASGADGFAVDIHQGTCASIDFSGFSAILDPVEAGSSDTTVQVQATELLARPHAVHLHAPGGEPVACGELAAG